MKNRQDGSINLFLIRKVYRNSLAKEPPSSEECPKPEKLVLAARLELPLQERLEAIDHIDKCGSCSLEFQTIITILRKEKEFLNRVKTEKLNIQK